MKAGLEALPRIAVLGAGHSGPVIARVVMEAGYPVSIAASGYPEIQSFKLPIARVSYFDTRGTIGVVTELVGATKEGHEMRSNLKAGKF